ncbi:MAG: molybdopterin-guanine dinucleotide biosynthesis protein B [Desulfobacterales bacterium]|nr:molybdopterin-guanine dinucleotide biosynthesis protein B [Desulfobacterales bacterium]
MTAQNVNPLGPPVVPIVGFSGAGKTTLLVKVIEALSLRGFRIGTIKHHSHDFEMDVPGKDTWRHKQAGASTTLISSPNRIGMVRDVASEMRLDELIPLVSAVDVILVEGFKQIKRDKLEVFRPEVSAQPACLKDEYLVALISDTPIEIGVPRFSPFDVKGVTDFIVTHFQLAR